MIRIINTGTKPVKVKTGKKTYALVPGAEIELSAKCKIEVCKVMATTLDDPDDGGESGGGPGEGP